MVRQGKRARVGHREKRRLKFVNNPQRSSTVPEGRTALHALAWIHSMSHSLVKAVEVGVPCMECGRINCVLCAVRHGDIWMENRGNHEGGKASSRKPGLLSSAETFNY